jgi:hypothetical protein
MITDPIVLGILSYLCENMTVEVVRIWVNLAGEFFDGATRYTMVFQKWPKGRHVEDCRSPPDSRIWRILVLTVRDDVHVVTPKNNGRQKSRHVVEC